MLESITAVLKPATESLQGKHVDLGRCMTTITLMKQQLQEMNGYYWHNFLFPKIMKLGEELNVDIAKPRQAGGGNQSQSVSEYYGKVWRSALQNVIDDLNLKFVQTSSTSSYCSILALDLCLRLLSLMKKLPRFY